MLQDTPGAYKSTQPCCNNLSTLLFPLLDVIDLSFTMAPTTQPREAGSDEKHGDTYQCVSVLEAQSRPSTEDRRSVAPKQEPSVTETDVPLVGSPEVEAADIKTGLRSWLATYWSHWRRVRSFKWWIVGTAVLSVPLGLLSTSHRHATISEVPASGLLWFLQAVWLGLWLSAGVVKAIDQSWRYLSGKLEIGLGVYEMTVKDLTRPSVFFLTAVISWRLR